MEDCHKNMFHANSFKLLPFKIATLMDDGCFILDLTGYPLILSFDFEHFHVTSHSITHIRTSVSSKTFLLSAGRDAVSH